MRGTRSRSACHTNLCAVARMTIIFWLVENGLEVGVSPRLARRYWAVEEGLVTSLHGLLINTVGFNLNAVQTNSLLAYLVWLHWELMASVVVIQIP